MKVLSAFATASCLLWHALMWTEWLSRFHIYSIWLKGLLNGLLRARNDNIAFLSLRLWLTTVHIIDCFHSFSYRCRSRSLSYSALCPLHKLCTADALGALVARQYLHFQQWTFENVLKRPLPSCSVVHQQYETIWSILNQICNYCSHWKFHVALALAANMDPRIKPTCTQRENFAFRK